MKENKRGFTLIELMIVIAIVGIIVAIAYPSYVDSVQRAKRTDGQSALMTVLQAQERHFAENRTYTVDLTELGYPAAFTSAEGFYTVSAGVCADAPIGRCVLLTATGDATTDGNLTIDSVGRRTPADVW